MVDAECGYLVVREDRTDPDSPTIRIQVIKVAAVSAEPAPDPIVAIPGGPGSGGPFWAWLLGVSSMSEVMRAERDLYILETRGAMSSEPGLYCPETVVDWAPMVEMTMAEEAEVRLAQFLACHERLVAEGINLSAYGYLDIAHDVADLAAVLDLETVNICGVSAGTPTGHAGDGCDARRHSQRDPRLRLSAGDNLHAVFGRVSANLAGSGVCGVPRRYGLCGGVPRPGRCAGRCASAAARRAGYGGCCACKRRDLCGAGGRREIRPLSPRGRDTHNVTFSLTALLASDSGVDLRLQL